MTDVLGRFAIVGAAWWITMAVLIRGGGSAALLAPSVALVIASVWAGGTIRSDLAGRIGIGLTCGVGAYLALLAALAMLRTAEGEGGGEWLLYFTAAFVGTYAVAAAIFLLPIFRVPPRAYAAGLLGFGAGGLLIALAAEIAVSARVFNFFTAPLFVLVPMFVGVASLAKWGRSSDPDGRYNRRTRP